jgi:imidazolonepropionase-like amidohydrolase
MRNMDRCILRGNILWGEDLQWRSSGRLLIEGGQIIRLVEEDEMIPEGTQAFNYKDCTILPGLIDTHCHLTLPGDGQDIANYLGRSSDAELVGRGVRNARCAAERGVTTLRDLGARGDTAFHLQRHISQSLGDIAPRVLVSGPALTQPRGHGWDFGIQVSGSSSIESAVQELAERGAEVIKLMASGGSTPGTAAWKATFTVQEIRAAVDAAHKRGLPVAAHVSCPIAAERCLSAGVDDLEHLNLWVDSKYTNVVPTALLMKAKRQGAFVGPTLQTAYHMLRGSPDSTELHDPRAAVRAKLYRDALANAAVFHQLGLRVIAGSDAGFLLSRFDEMHLAIRLLVEQGFSEHQALRAATVEASAALDLSRVTGSLRPGLSADLLIVRGNPLDDICALERTQDVFIRGHRLPRKLNEGPSASQCSDSPSAG